MNFDPQKFFIGLMDFFTILLPGALLTFLVKDYLGPIVLGDRYDALTDSAGWAAFIFISYLLGHLIFLLSAWLDELYDVAHNYTWNAQIAMLARRGRMLPWFARALIWLVFKRERKQALNRLLKIKKHALGGLRAEDSMNAFQWSKAFLVATNQQSMAAVQRFEADSKFFRCFAVVLLLLLVAWPFQRQWPPLGIPLVVALFLLALWRYMEQRYKSTNQAYWSVITLTARDGKLVFEKPELAADVPARAGGVVFRMRWRTPQYLLVEASDEPDRWVLPKGRIEEGELHVETAVREVVEESRVWARIVCELGDVSYAVGRDLVTVRFYLMRVAGRSLQKSARRRVWLPLNAALERRIHTETRELLQMAEQRRARLNR